MAETTPASIEEKPAEEPGSTGAAGTLASDVQRENAAERVRESGLAVELIRRVYIEELRSRMEAFYEHGNLADLVALCRALELSEEVVIGRSMRDAPVLEAMLRMLQLNSGTAM